MEFLFDTRIGAFSCAADVLCVSEVADYILLTCILVVIREVHMCCLWRGCSCLLLVEKLRLLLRSRNVGRASFLLRVLANNVSSTSSNTTYFVLYVAQCRNYRAPPRWRPHTTSAEEARKNNVLPAGHEARPTNPIQPRKDVGCERLPRDTTHGPSKQRESTQEYDGRKDRGRNDGKFVLHLLDSSLEEQ